MIFMIDEDREEQLEKLLVTCVTLGILVKLWLKDEFIELVFRCVLYQFV